MCTSVQLPPGPQRVAYCPSGDKDCGLQEDEGIGVDPSPIWNGHEQVGPSQVGERCRLYPRPNEKSVAGITFEHVGSGALCVVVC